MQTLWNILKEKVYSHNIATDDELMKKIEELSIPQLLKQNLTTNFCFFAISTKLLKDILF